MASNNYEIMEKRALAVREHIIRMSGYGGCFIGASLSCVDLLVYIYSDFLRFDPADTLNPGRDYFLLSKGHDVPALYGVFAELGVIDALRLKDHATTKDNIYWHPNRNIPGVEYYSGSLGHLLSVAMGIAWDLKRKDNSNRVIVLLGDGELNEGSVWEGLLVAAAKKLDNLLIIIDRNHFQANMRTEELTPLEPLEAKFAAFGCEVIRVNGHSFTDLDKAFSKFRFSGGKPSVIIADTVRGKGLPSIEERADRWFAKFSDDEVESLIGELHGQENARIHSEIIIAR